MSGSKGGKSGKNTTDGNDDKYNKPLWHLWCSRHHLTTVIWTRSTTHQEETTCQIKSYKATSVAAVAEIG